jgi:hypothetical protein
MRMRNENCPKRVVLLASFPSVGIQASITFHTVLK